MTFQMNYHEEVADEDVAFKVLVKYRICVLLAFLCL